MLEAIRWKLTLPFNCQMRNVDCDNSAVKRENLQLIGLPVLALPVAIDEIENWCRYADWRPNLYHQIKWVSSLVAVPNDLPLPPAWNTTSKWSYSSWNKTSAWIGRQKGKWRTTTTGRSFTSIQMFHTHTTLSHTIFHTQLCHTLSFTHNHT